MQGQFNEAAMRFLEKSKPGKYCRKQLQDGSICGMSQVKVIPGIGRNQPDQVEFFCPQHGVIGRSELRAHN